MKTLGAYLSVILWVVTKKQQQHLPKLAEAD